MIDNILTKDFLFEQCIYDSKRNKMFMVYSTVSTPRVYALEMPSDQYTHHFNCQNIRANVNVNKKHFDSKIGYWVYPDFTICLDENGKPFEPTIRRDDEWYKESILTSMKFLKLDQIAKCNNTIAGYRKNKSVFLFRDDVLAEEVDDCMRYGNNG